ncbi:hypothetical protein CcI49_11810 [Frankia sp. CcI49]|uniref:hypothetical protein n=1 Tax=Frankia sp. CcI49 TaxID=1745382 RepID=UPI000975FBF4|nr:hypothetical protein [Frankia sp. CcI49]ONH60408.1 hypothetical protein CcI49_11810 [Frankia sp. CcI49]
MREIRPLSLVLATAVGVVGPGLGAPWPVVAVILLALVVVAILLGFACLARAVMPDQSADRLAWWQDRRRYLEGRERRRRERK